VDAPPQPDWTFLTRHKSLAPTKTRTLDRATRNPVTMPSMLPRFHFYSSSKTAMCIRIGYLNSFMVVRVVTSRQSAANKGRFTSLCRGSVKKKPRARLSQSTNATRTAPSHSTLIHTRPGPATSCMCNTGVTFVLSTS